MKLLTAKTRRRAMLALPFVLLIVLLVMRAANSWIGEFPDTYNGTIAATRQLSWRMKVFSSRTNYVVAFHSRQTASTFELHYNQSTRVLERIKTSSTPFHAFEDKSITRSVSPQEIHDAASRGQPIM